MKKRFLAVLVLALALIFVFAGCSGANSNIVNGDFSSYDSDKSAFSDWQVFGTATNFARVPANSSDQDKDKGDYLKLTVSSTGVNYLYQNIKLKQGKTYKLSVDIKTTSKISGESGKKMRGAFVGFIEDKDFAVEQVNSTNGQWAHLEGYFTLATGRTLTLAVGIGHEDVGKAKGTAYFDNVKVEEVDEVPSGVSVATVKYGSSGSDKYSLATAGSTAAVVIGAILSLAIVALAIYLYRKSLNKTSLTDKKIFSPPALFVYVMVVAFIIRFLIALFSDGMAEGINALVQNIIAFGESGASGFIASTETTMPTGMMYMLWALFGISKLLNIGGDGMTILIRLPFILADIIAVYLIYMAVAKSRSEHAAAIMAGIYAVMPSVIMASTGWGMEISVVACFVIAMYISMLNKNYIGVGVLYTFALMFGNIAILLLPLVLAFYINALIKNKDSRIKIGVTSLVCFIAFYCLSITFMLNMMSGGHPFAVFEQMFKDLTANNTYTSNAFNLYGIFALNNVEAHLALNVLTYIFVVAVFAFTALCYFKNRNRLNILLMSAFTLIAVSTLGIRGSVETMILGIAILFVYAVMSNSKRAFVLFGGFSAISYINTSLIMSNSGFITNQLNSYVVDFAKTDGAFIFMSIVAVLFTGYFAYVVFDVCFRGRSYDMYPLEGKLIDEYKTRFAELKKRKADASSEA